MIDCKHEFVNVGFNSIKMACKYCGIYEKDFPKYLGTVLIKGIETGRIQPKEPNINIKDGTGISEDIEDSDGWEEESDFG